MTNIEAISPTPVQIRSQHTCLQAAARFAGPGQKEETGIVAIEYGVVEPHMRIS